MKRIVSTIMLLIILVILIFTMQAFAAQAATQRSTYKKQQFLSQYGYVRVHHEYEVDHIVPLSWGGADEPYNMQLLPKYQHKQKSARERSIQRYSSKSSHKFRSSSRFLWSDR